MPLILCRNKIGEVVWRTLNWRRKSRRRKLSPEFKAGHKIRRYILFKITRKIGLEEVSIGRYLHTLTII